MSEQHKAGKFPIEIVSSDEKKTFTDIKEVREFIKGKPNEELYIKVWYNKKDKLYNEFSVNNVSEFDKQIVEVTEEELINEFKEDIDKRYYDN